MKSYNLATLTKKIYESPIAFFSLHTLQTLFEMEATSTFYATINRLVTHGILEKIERNKYVATHTPLSSLTVANALYQPSYVSFESALSYYGILSQFPYEVTSCTTRQTTLKTVKETAYRYYHIQKALFWGYQNINGTLIAEKEKALADQLYLYGKGLKQFPLDEYDLTSVDISILQSYLSSFPQTRKIRRVIQSLHHYVSP